MGLSETTEVAARGEPFSLARLLDGIAFAALAAVLSFLFFSSRIKSPVVAAVPSALFTAASIYAFLLIRRGRLRRGRSAAERQAYDLWLCDEMLMSEPSRFQKFALSILLYQCRYKYVTPEDGGPRLVTDDGEADFGVLRRHPSSPVTAQDIVELVDRARASGLKLLVVMTTASFTAEAKEFTQAAGDVSVTLYDGEHLCAMAWDGAFTPPPGALDPYMERARALLKTKKRQSRPKFSSWAVSLRFALTGALLVAMAWLTPFRTWYLVCAALCFAIGAAAALFPAVKLLKRKAA